MPALGLEAAFSVSQGWARSHLIDVALHASRTWRKEKSKADQGGVEPPETVVKADAGFAKSYATSNGQLVLCYPAAALHDTNSGSLLDSCTCCTLPLPVGRLWLLQLWLPRQLLQPGWIVQYVGGKVPNQFLWSFVDIRFEAMVRNTSVPKSWKRPLVLFKFVHISVSAGVWNQFLDSWEPLWVFISKPWLENTSDPN